MSNIPENQPQLAHIFQNYGVSIAYVFGSVARHTSGEASDVDVAIVFQKEPAASEALSRESALSEELRQHFKRDVDIVSLAATKSPLLKHRAVRRGQLVHCTDHKRRHLLERDILHEFEDTQHLRAVQNNALQRRLNEGTFGKTNI